MNKDKQSSFSDLLEKILYDHAEFPDEFDRHRCYRAIIDLVKSTVNVDSKNFGDFDRGYLDGWCDCKKKILDKLDSPKEL